MMCTRIHNLKFWIFRPSLFKHVISFCYSNIPTGVGCLSKGHCTALSLSGRRSKQAWHTVWPQYKSRGTLSPWSPNTSSHTRHSSTCRQWNNSLYTLFSLSFTLQELSWVHPSTHICFTIWFNRSRKRIRIKMVYFTRHLPLQLATNWQQLTKFLAYWLLSIITK